MVSLRPYTHLITMRTRMKSEGASGSSEPRNCLDTGKEPGNLVLTGRVRFLTLGVAAAHSLSGCAMLAGGAQGVEVNEAAARAAQFRDLEVFCGLLQNAQFPSESFDYVRASHSLEHSTCPHETLDEIHRILKPEGTLLIAIPNIDSLSAKIFRQYWFHLCPPVHAFSYSVQTIRRMLELHWFRVRRVVFNSQYEGILGSAQIWLNRKNGNKSSEGLVFNARPLRIVCGWLERLCDVMRMGDVIEVTAAKANAPGKRFADSRVVRNEEQAVQHSGNPVRSAVQ